MQNREQQFHQEQEFRYYAGYHSARENEPEPSSEPIPPLFEPQIPAGSFTSNANQRQQPWNEQHARHGTTLAVLCYMGLWLTGFLFLLFGAKDRFVRFHALQSLLFFGGVNVLYIVLIYIIANNIPFFYGFAIFAFVLLNIVALVAWFIGVIGALQGRYVKLPFVGALAERAITTISLK